VTNRVRTYIGIGANLDDPVAQVQHGMAALRGLPDSIFVQCSALYRTEPVGFADQPDFINAVVALDTCLQAESLLDQLLAIEHDAGRRRGAISGGPRTLDLDLLLYGELEMTSASLTVPHPRMHERAFVLAPLFDIAPMLRIPGRGSVSSLLAHCGGQRVVRMQEGRLASGAPLA